MTININGIEVVILHDAGGTCQPVPGFWLHDRVIIHDPIDTLDTENVTEILQYLYDEGFIQDRSTPYQIINT